jgi:hypothetical protein
MYEMVIEHYIIKPREEVCRIYPFMHISLVMTEVQAPLSI